jgi:hypothetical protein
MAEVPSNIIMAWEFARHIDGFSIGSNDLTQLTLDWTEILHWLPIYMMKGIPLLNE